MAVQTFFTKPLLKSRFKMLFKFYQICQYDIAMHYNPNILKYLIRDQSLLMPGRGPEDIQRGYEKFSEVKGGARKIFLA